MPLWDALLGKHEQVVSRLTENGASLSSGDVGQFACSAVEQSNMDLLREIVKYGGDLTLPSSNGTTPLHVAVSEGNVEVVKFLLEQNADVDKPDADGWTPRALVNHQGHEDIKPLFLNIRESSQTPRVSFTGTGGGIRQSSFHPRSMRAHYVARYSSEPAMHPRLGKYSSEPAMAPFTNEANLSVQDGGWSNNRQRRKANNYRNSLIGIMSAANAGNNIILISLQYDLRVLDLKFRSRRRKRRDCITTQFRQSELGQQPFQSNNQLPGRQHNHQ